MVLIDFIIRKLSVFAIIFILLAWSAAWAQNSDAGLWTSISAEKKIAKSLSMSFNETFRFNENISELGNYFSEIGLEKKIIKGLSLGLNYRFINKRELNDAYSLKHRYLFDLIYKKKIEDFAVGFRSRFQSQVESYFLPKENIYGNIPDHYWRNKFSIRYQGFKKYKPALSAELWYPVKGRVERFDNIRTSAGIQYDLNKKTSIEFEYIFQKELSKNNPRADFISSIGYKFAF